MIPFALMDIHLLFAKEKLPLFKLQLAYLKAKTHKEALHEVIQSTG